jgi:hypothetical protein
MMFHKQQTLGSHFADRIPPTGKKAHPARLCKICPEKSKNSTGKRERKETVWWCPDCSVIVHARVLQIVPHKAKVFVNIGNVSCAYFFL